MHQAHPQGLSPKQPYKLKQNTWQNKANILESENYILSVPVLPPQNSIVHRDLKLENILLDRDCHPKVRPVLHFKKISYLGKLFF